MIDVSQIEHIFKQNPDAKVALFIRHGERENACSDITPLGTLLTPKGIETAKAFGTELKKIPTTFRLYTSPVFRCIQTAKAINEVLSNGEFEITISNKLGEPGLPILNADIASPLYSSKGCKEIYDEWKRELHYDALRTPNDLKKLVEEMIDKACNHPGVSIFVSHDATIAAMQFATGQGEYNISKYEWVDFLNGFFIEL